MLQWYDFSTISRKIKFLKQKLIIVAENHDPNSQLCRACFGGLENQILSPLRCSNCQNKIQTGKLKYEFQPNPHVWIDIISFLHPDEIECTRIFCWWEIYLIAFQRAIQIRNRARELASAEYSFQWPPPPEFPLIITLFIYSRVHVMVTYQTFNWSVRLRSSCLWSAENLTESLAKLQKRK